MTQISDFIMHFSSQKCLNMLFKVKKKTFSRTTLFLYNIYKAYFPQHTNKMDVFTLED